MQLLDLRGLFEEIRVFVQDEEGPGRRGSRYHGTGHLSCLSPVGEAKMMEGRRKALVFFLGSVLLLAAVLWIGFGGGRLQEVPGGGRERSGAGPGKGLEAGKGSSDSKKQGCVQEGSRKGEKASGRTRKRLEGFHPVLRHSVLAVRVFRRVGGKRDYLTGAKVVVACGNNWGDLALTDISLGGGGETFVCDSHGVASLPLESMRMKFPFRPVFFGVRAFSPKNHLSSRRRILSIDRFGRLYVTGVFRRRPLCGKLDLEVFPEKRIRVLVVDQREKGISGIPIGLYYSRFPLSHPLAGMYLEEWGQSVTNQEGRCTLSITMSRDSLPRSRNLYVGLRFPVDHPEKWFKKIHDENLKGDVVLLRMPPTGSVEVRVEDRNGAKRRRRKYLVHLVRVGWRDFVEERGKGFTSRPSQAYLKKFWRETRGGKVVYPWVGLGTRLSVRCVEVGGWLFSKKVISGPSSPGERVFVSISSPPKSPVISGILLGPDGKPLKKEEFNVYGRFEFSDLNIDPKRGFFLQRLRTDADGRFDLSLPPSFNWKDSLPLKQILFMKRKESGGFFPPFCVIDLPPPFTTGKRFLGYFRLEIPPFLCGGKVVDSDGKPVEGVEVWCFRPRIRDGKETWERVRSATGLTDAQGEWFIKGFWKWPELKVLAVKEGAGTSDLVLARPGARGLTLVLSGGGGVEARIHVARKVYLQRKMVVPQLVPRNLWWKEGSNQNASKKVFPNGKVVWKNLLPGTYDFRVVAQGDPERPVVLVPGIQVAPGKVTRDPRIQDLDIRGLVEEFLVVAKDPSGKILDPGHMWIKSKAWVGSMLAPSKKGLIALRRIGDRPSLEIIYPGYKKGFVQAKGKVVEVVLRPSGKKGKKSKR